MTEEVNEGRILRTVFFDESTDTLLRDFVFQQQQKGEESLTRSAVIRRAVSEYLQRRHQDPARVRFRLDVTPEVADMLEKISKESGLSLGEVIGRALALLKVAHHYKATHTLGIDSDPKKFDVIITGIP